LQQNPYNGRNFSPLTNDHLGEDINPKYPKNTKDFASNPVKAIADRKIVYYGPADGYGELVAVI